MLVTVDVGNTNMVFGLYEGTTLTHTFRMKTDRKRTSDEIGILISNYFMRQGLAFDQVEGAIISSVVPAVMGPLKRGVEDYLGHAPLVVYENIDHGLAYDIAGDEQLGADRAVACQAAVEKYGTPLVVLDFGTATTVDAIGENGHYQGGCITAGVNATVEALFQKAALLPHVELRRPDHVLSGTAVGQIQGGVIGGYIGAMETLVRRAKEEMGCPNAKVVATGGLASIVADGSDLVDYLDDNLILDGLRILYEHHHQG